MLSQTAIDAPAKGKGQRKREATEAALIAAFGRVVERCGLRSVGVNEVIKEAGIGKALLYRYFGGLPGLVRAWGTQNQVWHDLSKFHSLPKDIGGGDAAELIKRILLHHAQGLREDPLRVEILAEQFMQPTSISPALVEIRQQLAAEYQSIFQRHSIVQKHQDLVRLMMGAVTFMAMRAVKSPLCMGKNIGTQDGWDDTMHQVEVLIDAAFSESLPL